MVHNCPGGVEGTNLSVADGGQGDHGHVHGVGEAPAPEHHVPQHAGDRDYSERQKSTLDATRGDPRFVYRLLGDGPAIPLPALTVRHG
jgi:hypothetical protein